MKLLPVSLLALVAASALAQDAYRWVDKDGKVHYGDQAPLPVETLHVEQKRLNASVIASGGNLSYEARQAAANFPVTLYTTTDCDPGCKNGRDFLKRRNIPFAEKVVVTAADAAAFKKAAGTEALLVPTLLVGTESQKGYTEAAWASLLDAAGYPAAK